MKNPKDLNSHAGTGAIYGLGFVGALVYFIQHSNTLGQVLYGILKAIVWPALLVYKALELFKI